MKPCIIVNKEGRHIDNRVWKTCSKAKKHIKALLRNNSASTRRQVGYVGLRIKSHKPYEREINELKKAKDFIWS